MLEKHLRYNIRKNYLLNHRCTQWEARGYSKIADLNETLLNESFKSI